MNKDSKTVMEFKKGDYITFNNEQEWEEVLKGLLEIGEEVYKGVNWHGFDWSEYNSDWDAYAKTSEGDWSRTVIENYSKCRNNVTKDLKKLLQTNDMERYVQEALSAMAEAALSITNTNAKGGSLKALIGSLRSSQDYLTESNYYLIDGDKHWSGMGNPEVGMKVFMSGNLEWEAFDVTIEDVLKDALKGWTVYKGSFITQDGVKQTMSWNTYDWEVGITEAAYNKHLAMEEIKDCLGELLRKLEAF